MNLDQELLEVAMRRQGLSECVERVISMESESALPKGENYLSTIYRITLKVVLGNGRKAKKSLILKVAPQEKAKKEIVMSMGIFKGETMMYTTVLREMEMLMEEFGDTNDVLWCRLLHYEPYSSILLEDLKAGGFRMTRRQDCLDLDHALLVLRSLGRFHAMSKILEQRGIISKDDYRPLPLISDKNLIKYFVHYGLQTLAKAMEDHWGPEWYDVAQKLKTPSDLLVEKMVELGEVDESRFNCWNHGDCWSNNLMFKYNWQNRPYIMRFIDHQITHVNSPLFDISYFAYGSVHPKVRRENFELLLDTYHESLSSTLDFFGYEGLRMSREELTLEADRTYLFGITGSILIMAVMTSENENNFDVEEILESEGKKGFNPIVFTGSYKEKCADDVKIMADRLHNLESTKVSRKDICL